MQTHNHGRKLAATLSIAALAVSPLATQLASPAHAAGYNGSYTASSVKSGAAWDTQAFDAASGGDLATSQSDPDVTPARAPIGPNSHEIVIGESDDRAEMYRTKDFDGTKLADITRLAYSTYAESTADPAVLRQPTEFRLAVDTNGDGVRDQKLYFFPANNADQAPVTNGVWQHWDVRNGHLNVDGDGGPDAAVTWDQYVEANPDATVVYEDFAGYSVGGGMTLLTGGAGGGGASDPQIHGRYFVDRVIVGVDGADTLYDLGQGGEDVPGTSDSLDVTQVQLQGWKQQAFSYPSGTNLPIRQAFVENEGSRGLGSLRFVVNDDTNPNRVERIATHQYDGTLVRDLRGFEFSTLATPDPDNTTLQQPVYVRVNVDTDGNAQTDERLYFYPANNVDQGQQAVQDNAWQRWSAGSGKWNLMGDDGPQNTFTLQQFVVEHPDATIVANPAAELGGVAFQVGGGGAGQTNGQYYLDDVTISTADGQTGRTVSSTRFDLEADPTPTPAVVDVTGHWKVTKTGTKVRVDLVSDAMPANSVEGARLNWKINVDGHVAFQTNQHFGVHSVWSQRFRAGSKHTVVVFRNGAKVRTIVVAPSR